MKTALKLYRTIAIIIAIFLGFLFTFIAVNDSPKMQATLGPGVTQQDYYVLTKYAEDISRTMNLNVIEDENVKAEIETHDDVIIIKVESEICGIEAKYPLIDMHWYSDVNGDDIQFIAKIDRENVKISEHKNIDSKPVGIIMTTLCVIIVAAAFFTLVYLVPAGLIKLITWIKNKVK